jgi:amino acid transporter
MIKNYKNKQGGLIKLIIIIVIAIAILSYYGFDIKNFFTSPQAQKNFSYVWDFITETWTNYLAEPASKVWGICVEYIWTPLINMISK